MPDVNPRHVYERALNYLRHAYVCYEHTCEMTIEPRHSTNTRVHFILFSISSRGQTKSEFPKQIAKNLFI